MTFKNHVIFLKKKKRCVFALQKMKMQDTYIYNLFQILTNKQLVQWLIFQFSSFMYAVRILAQTIYLNFNFQSKVKVVLPSKLRTFTHI